MGRIVVAITVLVAATATGCSSDLVTDPCEGSTTCERTVDATDVTAGGLRFTLPPELGFRTDGFVSSGEAFDAFYASVPLGPVCSPGCGLTSFSPLAPGSVVVGVGTLSGVGAGAPLPADLAPDTTVAGRPAFSAAERPGTCGGDETVSVRIPEPAGNEVIVRACLFGPDLAEGERVIDALLSSAVPTGG